MRGIEAPPGMPSFIQPLDMSAVGVVTPGMQTGMVAARRTVVKWNVENLPIVDDSRIMPANFDPQHLAVFVRLPEAALPQKPSKGKVR